MKRLYSVVILVGLITCASLLIAQERGSDKPCTGATTTVEMRECQGQRYKKADARLNQIYKQLMDSLDEFRRTKLRAAQRAWVVFRDTQAAFEASAEAGGSLEPLLRLEILATLTEERVKRLQTALQGN
ncbi:MAG: lysozyme inhibitor LprI family protein [Candidatus Tectomicrobia bacterium]|nr:lysozyme inhibitor LprI family protein [Candidatus Tectomicrobia bacterium]